MVSSKRVWQRFRAYSIWLLATTRFLLGASSPLAVGQTRQIPQASPWDVYSWGAGVPDGYLPPSCHPLSYFSETPLRFAYGGEICEWQPSSFTIDAKPMLRCDIQQPRVDQVVQGVYRDPRKDTHRHRGVWDETHPRGAPPHRILCDFPGAGVPRAYRSLFSLQGINYVYTVTHAGSQDLPLRRSSSC